MKLAKLMVVALLVGIVVGIFFVFKSDDKVQNQYVVQQIGETGTSRADDETYAEEVKALIKLNQEKSTEITDLRKSFNEFTLDIENKYRKSGEEAAKKIAELSTALDQAQLGFSGNLTKAEEDLKRQIQGLREGTLNWDDVKKQIESTLDKAKPKGDQANKILSAPKEPVRITAPLSSANQVSPSTPAPGGNVSIRPYGMATPDGKGNTFGGLGALFQGGTLNTPKVTQKSRNPYDLSVSAGGEEDLPPIPVYTIPDTATLVGNSLMTPLIGRVPDTKNNVNDPFRFKFITGADNLATNGLRIPGIQNIVWTGYAIGVRDQSCVRAYVDTVTYTFEDGRIHTVSKGKNSGGGGGGSTGNQTLGYLTDQWGKPCIRGQYISNASSYMKDRTISAFIGAVADAAADSQIEMVENEQGDFRGFVTGKTGQFIAGKGLAGTAKEVAKYTAERAAGAFDVIYVDSGLQVQMFIETEIPIDYDPKGRKISYDYTPEETVSATAFD